MLGGRRHRDSATATSVRAGAGTPARPRERLRRDSRCGRRALPPSLLRQTAGLGRSEPRPALPKAAGADAIPRAICPECCSAAPRSPRAVAGHRGLGQAVHRGLVLLAMRETRLDAKPSSAPRTNGISACSPTSQARPAAAARSRRTRSRVNTGECPPELAETLRKTSANLPFARKIADRVAHLLARRQRERIAADMDVERLDPRIAAGTLDRNRESRAASACRRTAAPRSVPGCRRGKPTSRSGQDDRLRRARLGIHRIPDGCDQTDNREASQSGRFAANSPTTNRRIAIFALPRQAISGGDLTVRTRPVRTVQDRTRECYII